MKIATWNLCKGNSCKKIEELIARESPDIIALQETSHVVDCVFASGYSFAWAGKPTHGVGLAVKAPLEVVPGPAVENGPKGIFPFIVKSPSFCLHVLVVWTQREPHYIEDFLTSLDVYGAFLQEQRQRIVLGDFNAHPGFNKANGPRKAFEWIPNRLRDEFGLTSTYHRYHQKVHGDEHSPTHYFRWSEAAPFHIDYIFTPPTWRIEGLSVGDFESWKAFSDHRPIIADFEVPSA
ncbi:endonuclease/exonuclease/phosphatase family protein [soil metagenome]